MTRDEAMRISSALVEAKISHTIEFGYHERLAPPEQWTVVLAPHSMQPEQIEAAQEVATSVGRRLAFGGFRNCFHFLPPNRRSVM